MSKIKLLSIAVIGLLLVNIAIVCFLLFRKPPPRPDGKPPIAMEDRAPGQRDRSKNIIIDRLQLDRAQVAAYEKLIEDHQALVRPLQDSIMLAKNELYKSLTLDSFTGKDSLINKVSLFQRQMETAHYNHFTALKKLCKPDQLERYNKLTDDLSRLFSPPKR